MRARFKPLPHLLFAPDWDDLRPGQLRMYSGPDDISERGRPCPATWARFTEVSYKVATCQLPGISRSNGEGHAPRNKFCSVGVLVSPEKHPFKGIELSVLKKKHDTGLCKKNIFTRSLAQELG